ncbi:uncharacterized protein LAESUDRAFT_764831 [Laetiporus sulphureus 93-53]|uniref:RRM domain-containing protein n=1 Tax=Laetiporus sulphureus 93-53 TaxID=1314785 RepID=A0A165B435_9APHY|nr:uncharacterized protein LAESUDRAFT_764831 [Laetiporus sulphureus 93-53]KZT00184.1 hypothetical protein LAESUDRAFT_764831 [Laetiporus sulphureus 93-53]
MTQLDHETALSAVRNLNGQELGGRPLRIDLADSDPFLEGKTTIRGELIDGGETRAQWRERHQERGKSNDPNAFLANLPPGVPVSPNSTALDTISQMLATTNPTQILEVLAQMKAFVITHPEQARTLLVAHPQLGYALFQALLLNNIVDPAILKRMLQATSASVPTQPQVPPQAPAPYAQPLPMQPQQVFPPSMAMPHTPVHHPTPPIPAQAPMYPPAAAHMQQVPSPYYRPPPPAQPQPVAQAVPQPVPQPAAQTAVPAFDPAQRDMLMQVLSLTEAQINSLPPTEREQIQQLRKQFLGTV